MNHQNIMFYHYYFKHNTIDFLEASVLHTSGMKQSTLNISHEAELKNICIYASTCSGRAFFESVKYIFLSMCRSKCLVYTDLMGVPSLHVNMSRKILTSNNIHIEPMINQAIAIMMTPLSSTSEDETGKKKLISSGSSAVNSKESIKRKELSIEFMLHELKLNFAQMIDKMIETKVYNGIGNNILLASPTKQLSSNNNSNSTTNSGIEVPKTPLNCY
jgi:hypothetical protein